MHKSTPTSDCELDLLKQPAPFLLLSIAEKQKQNKKDFFIVVKLNSYLDQRKRDLLTCTAKLQDVVVLPTPPLPPTKIHFNVVFSRIERREESGTSSISAAIFLLRDQLLFLLTTSFLFFSYFLLSFFSCFLLFGSTTFVSAQPPKGLWFN